MTQEMSFTPCGRAQHKGAITCPAAHYPITAKPFLVYRIKGPSMRATGVPAAAVIVVIPIRGRSRIKHIPLRLVA